MLRKDGTLAVWVGAHGHKTHHRQHAHHVLHADADPSIVPQGYSEFRLSRYPTATKLINQYMQGSDPKNSLGPYWERPGRTILDNISGSAKPGQLLAIMGASGAGKSTFLDLLARRAKRGVSSGSVLVNGRHVPDATFRKVVGFVDQEDTLMSTLTVYETVLYSALLRLPREMSLEAKKYRTLETMNELGILGIKDARIGDTGE